MKRMLINATQVEEKRLAIVDGQKLLDYEIEIEGREQRKGNIYKAVVTRVEPSLEACFVDYGEDRHGFLPFKEISKQYFNGNVSPSQARIQDVIREGQELAVQVEKEERGNKGAALTTFISLAGRYVVLMPNNPRGGGVSRRIEGEDRADLKEAMDQLVYPQGASIIARTAGIGRSAPELQWDLNYLTKLWSAIDEAGKAGKGAFLIYQESSLVIRAIRDYFHNDVGDILIDTDDIFEQAHQFMAHVMPEHASKVKRYRDDVPLFSRFQIEHQIESAYARTVNLPSGGAIVIDQTEALVSVDVNSARAIKGGDIEETATRTNLEAADEVARQMRLRDLGGLVVIDFIDMDESRNRRDVENRLRDALRQDRARVQFGTISKFGLMEMSRQRLRPTLSEGASIPCPRCGGSGHVRDTESSALQILRIIQEESIKENTAAVWAQVPVEVASFLLNEKRTEIAKVELKQRISVVLIPNKTLETPNYKLERLKHDDPRLDNMDASYKMADEIEDPVAVTRRSQEPTNKQTPIIKGVLPDAPAPQAQPRAAAVEPAETLVAMNPVAARAASTLVNTVSVAQKPAEKGFFGWLKTLFGGSDAAPAAAAPAATAEARKEAGSERLGRSESREGRREGGREGGRGGERGRGGRGGERSGDRPERGDRPPRGEGRGEPRGEQRNEQRNEGRIERPVREGEAAERTPRESGREGGRGERGGRGRGERGDRAPRGDAAFTPNPATTESSAASAIPTLDNGQNADQANRGERAPREAREGGREPREGGREGSREGSREGTRGRGRGRDRGDRADRPEGEHAPRDADHGSDNGAGSMAAAGAVAAGSAIAMDSGVHANQGEQRERRVGEGEQRERRSRDRYGRDRGERGERRERSDQPANVDGNSNGSANVNGEANNYANQPAASTEYAQAAPNFVANTALAPPMATAAQIAAPTPAYAAPVAVVTAKAATSTGSNQRAAMPAVTSYSLPEADMTQVASSAGLQWVGSNPEKIAAVQAQIAAEAKPVHVPRPRPAPVAPDNGPLVLVETKRDLRDMTLPFEQFTQQK